MAKARSVLKVPPKVFSYDGNTSLVPEAATLIGLLKGPSYYNPRVHPRSHVTTT
ncbi:MAG: hypothetical protein ACLU4N_16255 [Butyricimonas faecihominis]